MNLIHECRQGDLIICGLCVFDALRCSPWVYIDPNSDNALEPGFKSADHDLEPASVFVWLYASKLIFHNFRNLVHVKSLLRIHAITSVEISHHVAIV